MNYKLGQNIMSRDPTSPGCQPLHLSKASTLLRFKLGKIQLPESLSKYIPTQTKYNSLETFS